MLIEIPEFKGYLISDAGRVYSRKSNKFLAEFINTAGYPCIKLYRNGSQHNFLIHRLLAYVYKDLPSLSSELEVDHVDRDPLNYSLDNLQVLTREQHSKKTTIDRGFLTCSEATACKCGEPKNRRADMCSKCAKPYLQVELSAEQIEYWVSKHSWVRAAKELGLSDNGLRKRYKRLTGNDPKSIEKVK
ncbi:putative HNH endonuclease [Serratia phage vB_SmaM-Kamaji]|nr:putative HNH endonuclease [Serratia phage vB_SmaM-Kamaji]